MNSKNLFACTLDIGLLKLIAASVGTMAVAADAATAEAVATAGAPLALISSDDPVRVANAFAVLAHPILLVGRETSEADFAAAVRAALAEQGCSKPVLTLTTDLHAIASTRPKGAVDRALLDRLATAEMPNRYIAIVNLPRSGSYFLSEILEKVGAGHPTEHLRPSVRDLSLDPDSGFDLERWFEIVAKLTATNGVFSTKIIFPFLAPMLANPRVAELIREAVKGVDVRFVYLWRRDKFLQAISGFRATRTRVFQMIHGHGLDAHRSIYYEFDSILNDYKALWTSEGVISQFIVDNAAPSLVINYEDLEKYISHYADGLQQFIGLHNRIKIDLESFNNKVMRDDVTGTLIDRFVADLAEHGMTEATPRNIIISAAELQDRRKGSVQDGPILEFVHPDFVGAYQARDWQIVDYHHYKLGNRNECFRGPPPPLEQPYFTCLGAAQTFGAQVSEPFPDQVATRIGINAFNLGFAGAGPRFFLDRPELIEIANKGVFAVIQVLSGRSVGNSVFDNPHGRNVLVNRETGQSADDITAYIAYQRAHGDEAVGALFEETRANWIAQMRALLDAINVPKLLLWFSERSIGPRQAGNEVLDHYGRFPQLIFAEEIEQLKNHYDVLVDGSGMRGSPEPHRSRVTGGPATIRLSTGHLERENRYYPSSAMHEDVAKALITAIEGHSPFVQLIQSKQSADSGSSRPGIRT